MARLAQLKIGISPYHRELLAWGADKLGITPATYARELLTETLARLLDDQDIRREWTRRPRRSLEALEAAWDGDGLDAAPMEIRAALQPRAVTR